MRAVIEWGTLHCSAYGLLFYLAIENRRNM